MPSWIGNTVGFGDAVSPGSTGRHRGFILRSGFRVSQAFALTWVGVRNRMAGNVSGALSGLWLLVKKVVSARGLGQTSR
jgi:hypothetical protein